MWRTSSRGITGKLRTLPYQRTDIRCTLATDSGKDSKAEPPKDEFKTPEKVEGPKKSKRSAGKFAFRTVSALTLGTAGVIGYAWYDHEFREKVSTNVPYTKDAFDAVFVFLPDSPSIPAPLLTGDKNKPKSEDEPASFMKKKSLPPESQKQESPTSTHTTAIDKKVSTSPPSDQQDVKKTEEPKPLTAKEIQELKKKAEKEAEEKRKAEARDENAALEVAIESLIDSSSNAVQTAVAALDSAILAAKRHTDLLKTAMNDKSGGLENEGGWDGVVSAYEVLERASEAGDKAVAKAWENVENLRTKMESGRENVVTKTNRILSTARDRHNKLRQELTRKIEELSKEERDSKAQLQFKSLVEKGKQQFKKELESLSPDLKISKGKLSDEELNMIIAHAHKRIEQLQRQLADQFAFERQRTDSSLEQQKERDKKMIEDAIIEEKERLKFQLDAIMAEREKEIKDKYHKAQIDERYRMEEWKDRETQRKLDEQKEELTQKYQQIIEVVKINEREEFLAEMAEWIGRIKGFDRAISARAETEEQAEQAQQLWLACLALNGAIRAGNYLGETWEAQLKPLEKEVDAVFDAAHNNPFILIVLESVPEKALTRGVYTEDNLKLRFDKVHHVARRVALIDETGGSLFKYFVSWMQSIFVTSGRYTVHAKTEDAEIDMNELDTFGLLANAKYWVEKGDLEVALRYMNQLTGESRRVALDWIEETRLLLETRQASYTLMAFASAQGLGTIF